MRSDPHLCVRLVGVYFVGFVTGSLQARHHALVARLSPGIFLASVEAMEQKLSKSRRASAVHITPYGEP